MLPEHVNSLECLRWSTESTYKHATRWMTCLVISFHMSHHVVLVIETTRTNHTSIGLRISVYHHVSHHLCSRTNLFATIIALNFSLCLTSISSFVPTQVLSQLIISFVDFIVAHIALERAAAGAFTLMDLISWTTDGFTTLLTDDFLLWVGPEFVKSRVFSQWFCRCHFLSTNCATEIRGMTLFGRCCGLYVFFVFDLHIVVVVIDDAHDLRLKFWVHELLQFLLDRLCFGEEFIVAFERVDAAIAESGVSQVEGWADGDF